ncbi:MAG: serine/threonine protein kinase, partial [Myxococcales bacterium]|nr:serine/threonine protein kinase [Myxococcales bacterium]
MHDDLPVTAQLRDAPDLGLDTTDEALLLHRIEAGLRRDADAPPRIDRFTVISELGHGGMGSVLAAYDPRLDRSVALKRVRVGTGVRAREHLQTEARMMARLNHPNIVTVFEVVEDGPEIFIVMELVRGQTLRAWASEPRAAAQRAAILVAAGRGLAHAHACGLIHRDFKPDNVFIDEHGVAKVGDFGLAQPSTDPPSTEGDTDGDARAGTGPLTSLAHAATPAYAAPEIFAGSELGVEVDQFAFCVTAFELFVGRRPWPHTAQELDAEALRRAGADLRASDCPRGAVEAILRGLRPDPRERWPSMAPLLAALDPRARRAGWHTGLGLLAALGLGTWAALAPTEPCPAVDPGATLWPTATQQQLREAVGPTIWPDLERRTAAFVERWGQSHRDNCRALHVRGEQSNAAFDRRARCLALQRTELEERLA